MRLFRKAERAIIAEPDPRIETVQCAVDNDPGDRIFHAIYEAIDQEDPGLAENEYVCWHVTVTSIEKEK